MPFLFPSELLKTKKCNVLGILILKLSVVIHIIKRFEPELHSVYFTSPLRALAIKLGAALNIRQ